MDKYKADEGVDFNEVSDIRELARLVRPKGVGVIIYSVKDRNAAVLLGQVCKIFRDSLKLGVVRLLVTTTFKQAQVIRNFEKMGVSVIEMEPIPDRAFQFKVKRQLQTLEGKLKTAQKKAELERKRHSGGQSGPDGERKNQPKIVTKSALKLKSDFFLMQGGSGKHFWGRWSVQMTGPSPRIGRWVEDEAFSKDGERVYRWDKTENEKGKFLKDKGTWICFGSKPEFRENRWNFSGKAPKLAFYDDKKEIEVKFHVDEKTKNLIVAKDSPQGRAFIDLIVESIEASVRFGVDGKANEKDFEMKDGDKERLEKIKDEILNGKKNEKSWGSDKKFESKKSKENNSKSKFSKDKEKQARDINDKIGEDEDKSRDINDKTGEEEDDPDGINDRIKKENKPQKTYEHDGSAKDSSDESSRSSTEEEKNKSENLKSRFRDDENEKEMGEKGSQTLSKDQEKGPAKPDEFIQSPELNKKNNKSESSSLADVLNQSSDIGSEEDIEKKEEKDGSRFDDVDAKNRDADEYLESSEKNQFANSIKEKLENSENKMSSEAMEALEQAQKRAEEKRQEAEVQSKENSEDQSEGGIRPMDDSGPTMSPITIAFMTSELMIKRGGDDKEIADKYCKYLSAAMSGMNLELWYIDPNQGAQPIGKDEDEKEAEFKEYVDRYLADPDIKESLEASSKRIEEDVLVTDIRNSQKKRIGVLVLKGKDALKVPEEYLLQVGHMIVGLLESLALGQRYIDENKENRSSEKAA